MNKETIEAQLILQCLRLFSFYLHLQWRFLFYVIIITINSLQLQLHNANSVVITNARYSLHYQIQIISNQI